MKREVVCVKIISGTERGRTLSVPRGMQTRPTQARVRESLFNILRPYLAGTSVLDLFAGSGAMALEALSQGADCAILVDSARSAQQAVAANIAALGMEERAQLLRCDWQTALSRLSGRTFDLIFLDPPYAFDAAGTLLETLVPFLREGGRIVYEHRRDAGFACPPALTVTDTRRYSDTEVSFITRCTQEVQDPENAALSGHL